MSHTPGPWNVGKFDSFSEVITIEANGNYRYVARCPRRPKAESEANARLIAAAPDLLAACQETVRVTEGITLTSRWDAAVVHARAAIANATGEA